MSACVKFQVDPAVADATGEPTRQCMCGYAEQDHGSYFLTIVEHAAKLAMAAHQGQFRRDGVTPYFVHCKAVADRLTDPIDKAVGYLHDILEDGRLNVDDLNYWVAHQLPDPSLGVDVIDGVVTLTRKPEETYGAFIARIKAHRQGRWARVKIADNMANLADSPTDQQIVRYDRSLLTLLFP